MSEFPILEFGVIEREKRLVFCETLKRGVKIFLENGAFLIKGVFPAELIQKLHGEYVETHSSCFQDREFVAENCVNDQRAMLTVAIEGAFNDPEIYANPFVIPLISRLLQDQQIIGSFGSVVSLPGAEQQRVHRDAPLIFDPDLGMEEEVNVLALMPPYAITLFIPLLPVTPENGATRMWLGSHLTSSYKTEGLPFSDALAEVGDAILCDYRLLHAGLANHSNAIRPILYSVYNRPWFKDCVNFIKQKPLIMADEEFAKVPEQFRSLFEERGGA